MNGLRAIAALIPWATVAAATVCATATQAQPVCKPRAEMIEILARKFREHQRMFGLQNDRRVLELYASADGTWTAILSMPNGTSCVVAAGEAWTVLPPIPAGEPAGYHPRQFPPVPRPKPRDDEGMAEA